MLLKQQLTKLQQHDEQAAAGASLKLAELREALTTADDKQVCVAYWVQCVWLIGCTQMIVVCVDRDGGFAAGCQTVHRRS